MRKNYLKQTKFELERGLNQNIIYFLFYFPAKLSFYLRSCKMAGLEFLSLRPEF
jgi:hypothetical protein